MKKTVIAIIFITSSLSVSADGNHKSGHGMAHWMAPDAAATKPNPIKSDAASIDRGKKTYFQNCASCHGAKAMGDGPAAAALTPKPANLAMMSGMHPDGDFAWKIANGRGAMPAWKNTLSENQIWELVNYLKSLKPKAKGNMMGMGKMDMGAMKKMMPNMDHSNMKMEDMKKMMAKMEKINETGHSNRDGHHNPKPKNSHDKPHTH